jgi:hypothetical protein
VHTGVCSARPVNSHFPSGDAGKRFLDSILNGFAAGLALPSTEASAVVSDDQL